jgi:hypothetical protein
LKHLEVIDNFVPPEEWQELQEVILADDCPWFWNNDITSLDNRTVVSDPVPGGQFTHTVWRINEGPQTVGWKYFLSLFEQIRLSSPKAHEEVFVLLRAKLNMNPRESENVQLGSFHIDFPIESETAILYINTNNGYTEFEDGTKIESVANRLCMFPSHMRHAGFACSDQQRRVVLNMNYIRCPKIIRSQY